MDAKKKAKELVEKYFSICNCTIAGTGTIFRDIAKQCAIAMVDEVSKIVPYISRDNCETIEQFRASYYQFADY